ncbi:hypothetical protein NL676_035538 [Syzygium grande]|nr:hypothetical protein NL676_035538 [Syzygium grande]
MSALTSIDVSYNDLEGPLPNVKAFIEAPFEAIEHNKGLCGNVVDLPKCNSTMSKKCARTGITIVTVLSFLGFLILSCTLTVLVIINHRRRRIIKGENNERANDMDFMRNLSYDGKVFYDRIVEATGGFDSKYYVGEGAYGIVYKAEISEGQMVAVKQISSSQEDKLAYSTIPTEKCDVYSFGVIALETIMGKHPGYHVSQECSSFAQFESPMMLKDVLDQRLLPSRLCLRDAQNVVLIAKLAFACLQANPRLRPTMGQVSRELRVQVFMKMPFSAISLEQLRDLNVRKFGAFTRGGKF